MATTADNTPLRKNSYHSFVINISNLLTWLKEDRRSRSTATRNVIGSHQYIRIWRRLVNGGTDAWWPPVCSRLATENAASAGRCERQWYGRTAEEGTSNEQPCWAHTAWDVGGKQATQSGRNCHSLVEYEYALPSTIDSSHCWRTSEVGATWRRTSEPR